MDKSSVSTFFKGVGTSLSKHSPEILTGIGIVGMVSTTIMAVKATPKALQLCDQLEIEKLEQNEEPKKIDYVKAAWKCYIPAAVTGATSIACLIGASSVHVRRNAALATAYKLSETAYKLAENARTEYRDKVIEAIGEKKERAIRDEVAKGKLQKDPVQNKEVVITPKGDTLCYDGIFGRYFKSDRDTIIRAINEINRQILINNYISLNEFYSEIGLSPIEIGDELGWNVDHGQIEIDFSSQLAADGTPCLVMSYNIAPIYDYSKFW